MFSRSLRRQAILSPPIQRIAIFACVVTVLPGCRGNATEPELFRTVPHEDSWGIYALDLANSEISLVYSTPHEIQTSALRLSDDGSRLVFAQEENGAGEEALEIFSIGADGQGLTRLTDNDVMDVYPAWSPDGTRIVFLSRRDGDLDLYLMDADGTDAERLYDSGDNDADVDWKAGTIVFTSQFAIWKINPDGTGPVRITDPPHRGEWGQANLPAGDYDPRLSPDGESVVFERLLDTNVVNGAYDFYVVSTAGSGETRLTETGYAQGLASWSHSGEQLVFVVAAIGAEGKYDLYTMASDGSQRHNVTPSYVPANFLCHAPIFSLDDTTVFFIGQWWE